MRRPRSVPKQRARGIPMTTAALTRERLTGVRLGLRENAGAVHAARRRQRVRRRDGRHGAQHPAGDRRAGVSAGRAHGDAVVHRGLRRREGAHELRAPAGFADRVGRKHVLVAGWLVAVPGAVPAHVGAELELDARRPTLLLGISQGLTWSTTVIMKIDLVGASAARPGDGSERVRRIRRARGAARWRPAGSPRVRLRPEPFYLGVVVRRVGLAPVGAARARDTPITSRSNRSSQRRAVGRASPRVRCSGARRWRDRNLSSVSQAGLVNNLNDGMAWGLFPLVFAAAQHEPRPHRRARGDLSGDVGRSPARDRRALRPHRPEVADRRRHVDAGGRYRRRDRRRARSPGSRWARCCSGSAPRWCIRRCSPRSATSRIHHGARRPSACIGCGVTLATPSVRCSPASPPTRSELSAAMWSLPAITLLSGVVAALRMDDPVRLSVT